MALAAPYSLVESLRKIRYVVCVGDNGTWKEAREMLTEQEVQDLLLDIIQSWIEDNEESPITLVRTYSEVGILTGNKGLELELDGEQKVELTLVSN